MTYASRTRTRTRHKKADYGSLLIHRNPLFLFMVPELGIEPRRGRPRWILSPLRLPISPLRLGCAYILKRRWLVNLFTMVSSQIFMPLINRLKQNAVDGLPVNRALPQDDNGPDRYVHNRGSSPAGKGAGVQYQVHLTTQLRIEGIGAGNSRPA